MDERSQGIRDIRDYCRDYCTTARVGILMDDLKKLAVVLHHMKSHNVARILIKLRARRNSDAFLQECSHIAGAQRMSYKITKEMR